MTDALFEPIALGPLELKNRIYQPPHCTGMQNTEQNAKFRASKARGGFGFLIQEATAIHPSGDQRPRPLPAIWEEGTVADHERITSAVHEEGALVGIQLNHTGVHNAFHADIPMRNLRDHAPLSSSDTQEPKHNGQAKAMDESEIRMLIDAFGDAADRARQAGYDAIEIQAGHGYLVAQFLSPLYNKRDDEWGGDWRGRSRFFLEVAREVRSRVGDDLAVGARFTYNELYSGGLNAPEDEDPVRMMARVDDHIDFWDIDIGNYETHSDIIAPAYDPKWDEHYQLNSLTPAVAEQMRAHGIETPIGGCGRVRDAEKAARTLEETPVDMIGMVRQSIADPMWPTKVAEGREEDIRECIGCNTCIAGFGTFKPLMCVQNPAVGQEYRGFHQDEFETVDDQRTVLVVGGGPCGLEFARVAGHRGHDVDLHEARGEVGGHTRHVVSKLPGRDEWEKQIAYREHELADRSNVTVETNSELDVDDVADYGADAVVFATGAAWNERGVNPMTKEPLPGWDRDHVVLPGDVVEGRADVGDSVLVVDGDNHMVGPGVAELLGNAGHDVTLMGYPCAIGPNQEAKLQAGTMHERLHEAGVEVTHDEFPTALTADGAEYVNIYHQETKHLDCDTVVLTTKRSARRALHDAYEARANGTDVHLTGEAVTPKTFFSVAKPLWWAHKLGREV